MHSGIRIGLLVFAAAALLPAVTAFSCSVKDGGCGSNEKCVFTLYNTTDSHISACASPNAYNYKVCCNELAFDCAVRASCYETEDFILPVFSDSDAHYNKTAGYSVCCYKPAQNYVNCSVKYNACSARETCLASVYDGTGAEDSHAGDCSAYDYKVCCGVIDTTPPDITDYSTIPQATERGSILDFSAAIFDYSGIDRAAVCDGPAMCYGQPGNYCNMSTTPLGRYSCSYNTSGIGLGQQTFYIVANDTFGNMNSARLDTRVRTTSIAIGSISPQPADLQGAATVKADYSENASYPIADADCIVSGDVSGGMAYSGGQYAADLQPPKLEANFFTVTCSKSGYPSRSVSGSFIARDLQVLMGVEFDPLALGQRNVMYAYVSTLNDYAKVDSAGVADFSVSGPAGFAPVSGNFAWNSSTDRWEASFTPTINGTYSVLAYFKNNSLNGSGSLQAEAGDGIALSADVSTLDVDIGSSALANVFIDNKRKKEMLYNITLRALTGDLYPVSFDGQALSSHKHSTFALVPAKSSQSHPLLIKGMEVSSSEREILIDVRETVPPYNSATYTLRYKVFNNKEGRKFAPDLTFLSVLTLAAVSAIFACRKRP